MALGVALAALIGVVLFVVLRPDVDSVIPKEPKDVVTPSEKTPKFSFKVQGVQPISTEAGTERGELSAAADDAAKDIAAELNHMYRLAFLDPDRWRPGRYNQVFGFFEGKAQVAAQHDVKSLTLGMNGDETYEEVPGAEGTLSLRVLVDPDGNPYTAVANVQFGADAVQRDGKETILVSKGQYFLRNTGDGGWAIYAFDVKRWNQVKSAAPKEDTATTQPTTEATG